VITGPVWLYALTWNEQRVLPFFFRHYDPWVDRYILYDDGSTDATLGMLAAHPRVERRRFERAVPNSFVESHRLWQNNVWKEARGQCAWVVVTAVDEHLWHPGIGGYLEACAAAGVTAIPALGFDMIVDDFPSPGTWLAERHRLGVPQHAMNKLSLFNPDAIGETNFSAGRHYALPEGRVRYPEIDALYLLHYKYLGVDYVADRNAHLRTGLGADDVRAGRGEQYAFDRQTWEEVWPELKRRAIDYRDPAIGFTTHVDRWWRGPRPRG
jgi:hypothetical protein